MKKSDHLPMYGVGPVCVYLMVGLLAGGVALVCTHHLDSGAVPMLRIPMIVIGSILVVFGVFLWVRTVIVEKIGDDIRNNHLSTTGTYAFVRNPIYAAVAIALTGIGLMFANLWLLILPVLFWLDITLFMIFTEEKWLTRLYGDEYRDYCRRVNRCIPWFPRKKP